MEIICHVMSSVDGRLLPQRWTQPADGATMGDVMRQYATAGLQLQADAWMWGKGTLVEIYKEVYQPSGDSEACCAERVWRAERHSERIFVAIDPDANILFTDNTLRGDDILIVLPLFTPCDYLMKLRRQGISYMMVDDTSDLADIFTQLEREFSIHRLLLQGGGIIDGAALAQQVLTQISIVTYPGIDGKSGAPSVFEYTGCLDRPAASQRLRLQHVEQLQHGVVWTRYAVEREP